MKMKSLLTKPKYDGYQIKCKTCKCEFFVPFDGVRSSGIWDDCAYVMCPNCTNKIEQSFFLEEA